MNPNNLQRLLNKGEKTLQDHLADALSRSRVSSQYQCVSRRKAKENSGNYARRLATSVTEYQFIHVPFDGRNYYVAFGISGPLITKFGKFTLVPAQIVGGQWGIHYFLFSLGLPELLQRKSIFVRLDSGCLSGQLFGDVTCDCREQFELSLSMCADHGAGVVVNIPAHDGRGWGEYKMANQRLMDECGINTVEAARLFYGTESAIDQRTYTEAVIMLRAIGFDTNHRFKLATNNPRKIGAFNSFGLEVEAVQSVVAKNVGDILAKNLAAKSRHWKHNLSTSS